MDGEELDMSQHVMNAVFAFRLRWARRPRVVLAITDDDLRSTLADELRHRGFSVVEAAHARGLHAAVRLALDEPEAEGIELFVAESVLAGCSPHHALGFARSCNLVAPAVVIGDKTGHDELDPCPRAHALDVIDRTALRALRRRWSERPVAA